MVLDPRKQAAARYIAGGISLAGTARKIGVDRSTLHRWSKEEAFNLLVSEEMERARVAPEVAEAATKGLTDLIPQALMVLEGALDGKPVQAGKARIALDIIKAATSVARPSGGGGPGELEKRLQALDERDVGSD